MSFEIDRYAHLQSIVHRWDPRYKIASLGSFMLCTAFLQSLPLAIMALMISFFTFIISRIPMQFIAQGLKWLLIFLFPFFLLLPISYPSSHVINIYGIPFSEEGFRLALLIFIKAVAVVVMCYVTFGSARFHHSMYAMQRLRCPSFLVHILLFCYRYIFVLLEEMQHMYNAMIARGLQLRLNRRCLNILGHFVGSLLIRSFERTDRIYQSMLSKGFTGQYHCLVTFKTNYADIIKTMFWLFIAAYILITDRLGPFHRAVTYWY